MEPLSFEEYNEKVKKLKNMDDVVNFAKELIAPTLQKMLEAELEQHLGYKKYDPKGKNSGNNRNGSSSKTITTSMGEAELKIPRDRNGTYEPIAVKKHESRQSDVEEKITAMYARGLSTRDIEGYMREIYGISVSPDMVSMMTDKVVPLIREWQMRPLARLYTILYLDGVHFKVRENGKIVSKCCYVILGINDQGYKEILGIWVGEEEGAKFWMKVLSEMKQRGTEEILICCIDGLSGFAEGIKAVYPDAKIQECIVHQVRNTLKYIPHKDKKAVAGDLKKVYGAVNAEAGFQELQNLKQKWLCYSHAFKSWETKWERLSLFYEYPVEIRRIIYTTNAIEGLNRQFRKVTKTTVIFPHDEALLKLLWLAQRNITKKWTMPVRNWGIMVAQLAVLFPGKIQL